jgi:hypothetical protein
MFVKGKGEIEVKMPTIQFHQSAASELKRRYAHAPTWSSGFDQVLGFFPAPFSLSMRLNFQAD